MPIANLTRGLENGAGRTFALLLLQTIWLGNLVECSDGKWFSEVYEKIVQLKTPAQGRGLILLI